MRKIIFGAGVVGKALYGECQARGIKIDGFCDNDNSKGVLPVEEAKKYKAEFYIATGDVKFANEQLKGKTLNEETADILAEIKLETYDKYTQFCIENCIDANRNWDNPYFLRSLDLMITEKCSLKCRDCSNLMPYYKNPKDCDISQVILDTKTILDTWKVGEFRIIGGEPFMNKEWELLLAYLIKDPKVKRIVIYTNGTIVPSTHLLINPKVFVQVTDYGKLSKKLNIIKDLFDTDKVAYQIVKPRWTDCGKAEKKGRTQKELDQMFKDCCSRNVTLSNGRLFPCAFSANLARLGIYDGEDFCDYCSGRPLNAPEIEPAIQISAEKK